MTIYYANGSETNSLTTEDLRDALRETFEKIGDRQKGSAVTSGPHSIVQSSRRDDRLVSRVVGGCSYRHYASFGDSFGNEPRTVVSHVSRCAFGSFSAAPLAR